MRNPPCTTRVRSSITILVLFVALLPSAAQAQATNAPRIAIVIRSGREHRDSTVRSRIATYDPNAHPDRSIHRPLNSLPDSTTPSHAVRNGFWIGAFVGALTAAYAATYAESGCTAEPCHARAIENRGIVVSAIVGGLLGGALGAGIGKLSHRH